MFFLYQALILSAWWHDAGRTLNKKASFVLMPFVDDTLSALMLWYWTIRFGLFGSVVGMATRIIFCKSMGTGTVLTKILLRKKNRILLDILKDADALDLLNVERSKVICNLAESSIKYRIAYRIMIRWIFVTNQFEFRTQSAKELFIQILRNFLEWIKQTEVYEWHLNFIPKHKLDKNIAIGELKLIQFSTII